MDESKTLGTKRDGTSPRLVADLVNRFGSEHADVTPDDSKALAGMGEWLGHLQSRSDPSHVVLSGGWTPAGGRDVQERIASRYRLAERPPIATGIAAFLGGLRWTSAPEQRFFEWGGFDDFESLMLEPELPEGADELGDTSPRPAARAGGLRAGRKGRGQASVQSRSAKAGEVARLSVATPPPGAPMAAGNLLSGESLAPPEPLRAVSAGAAPVVLDGVPLSPRTLPALTAALARVSEVFQGPAAATARRFSPAAFSAALKVVSLTSADAPSQRRHGAPPQATTDPRSQAAAQGVSPRAVGFHRGMELGTVVPGSGTGDPTPGTPETRISARAQKRRVPATSAADPTMRLGRYGFARDFSLTPAETFSSSVILRALDEAPDAGPDAFSPGAGYVQPAAPAAQSTALVGDNDIVYVSLEDLDPAVLGGGGEAEASLRVPTGLRTFARLPATVRERLSSHALTVTEAVRLQQALARSASSPAGRPLRSPHAPSAAAQAAVVPAAAVRDRVDVQTPPSLPAALRNAVAARTLPAEARFGSSEVEPAQPRPIGQPAVLGRPELLASQVRALRAALQPRTLRAPLVGRDAPSATPGTRPGARTRAASIESWIHGLAAIPGVESGASPTVGLGGSLTSAANEAAGPRQVRAATEDVGQGRVVPAGILDGESFSWSGFDFLAPQAEEAVVRDEQRVVAAALAAAAGASPTGAQRAAQRSTSKQPRRARTTRVAAALEPTASLVGGVAPALPPTVSEALAGLTGTRPTIAAGVRLRADVEEVGRGIRRAAPARAQAPVPGTADVAPATATGRPTEAASSALTAETPELAAYSYLPRLVAHLGVRQAAAVLPALRTAEARRTLTARTPEQISRLVGPERTYAEGWLSSAVELTREWLRPVGPEGPAALPEDARGVESAAASTRQRGSATAVGASVAADARPRRASAEVSAPAFGLHPGSTGEPVGHERTGGAVASERGRYWGGFAPLRSRGASGVADVLRQEALAMALASRHAATSGDTPSASSPWDRAWAGDLLTLVELEEALRTGPPAGQAEVGGDPAAETRIGRAGARAGVEPRRTVDVPVDRATAAGAPSGRAALGAVELGRALTAARQVQERMGAPTPVVQRVAAGLLGRETVGLRLSTAVDGRLTETEPANDVVARAESAARPLGGPAFTGLADRLERLWGGAAESRTSLTGLPDGTTEAFWAEDGALVLPEPSEAEASSPAGGETGGLPTALATRAAARRGARPGRLSVSRGGAADQPLTAIERVAARRLAAAASGALRRQPQAGGPAEPGRSTTAYPTLMAVLADRPDVAARVLRAVGGQADTAAQLLRLEPARLPRAVRDALTQAGIDWAAPAPAGGGAVAAEATRRASAAVLDIETMIALALADTTGGVGDPIKSGLAERALGEIPAAWAHANDAMVQRLVERLTRSRAVRPLDIGFADMEPVAGDTAATSTEVPEAGGGVTLVQPGAAPTPSENEPARRTRRDVVAPEGPGAPMTAALDAVDMSPVTWDLIQTRLSSAPVSHARPANVSGVAQAMLSNRVLTRSTLPLVAPAVAQVAAQAQLSASGGPTADAQPTQTQAAAGDGAGAGLEKQPKLDMERIAKEIASRISLRARRENDRRGTWL